MRHRHFLALLLLLAPSPGWAQDVTPESLLPAGAQAYFRWDGVAAHRADYTTSSLGRMMQGDTGTFVAALYKQLEEGVVLGFAVDQLLRGESPQKLKKMRMEAREAARLLPLLGEKGCLLAVEVRRLEPPQAQLTLVVPDVGPGATSVFAVLRLAAGLARAEVKESKVEGRAVAALDLGGAWLAWWAEGKHAVIALGTDKPESMVKAAAAGPHLTENALYKRLQGFKGFTTVARGFMDAKTLAKLGGSRGESARRLIADMGVENAGALVYYSGFEGRAERGLIELDAPGQRKGLLGLLYGTPFGLADVPPLPPDVISWSMANFGVAGFYDTAILAIQDLLRIYEPDSVPQVGAFLKEMHSVLGIDLRKDLLESLGDRMVEYTSPAEGPLTLGQTLLLRVKDADKLHTALAQAIKGLGAAAGTEVRVKKRAYRGVDMRLVMVKQQGFIFVPTYAVVDGWLVVSLFPQNVEGFIARSRGELPCWKPAPVVEESLRKLPSKFVGISYTDPRPTFQQLLSLAPLLGGITANLNPSLNFDVGSLPNGQEVTRHLFPNVSVTTDDGATLRHESRGSLSLPLDLGGLDTYGLFFLFGAFASFAF
jgi:hypothetical protein